MSNIQAFVEMVNDRNIPDWRNYPIDRFVLGMFGERGEIAEAAKKNSRHHLGWKGVSYDDEKFHVELKSEIAGTLIYCSLIAGKMGWNLLDIVKNEVELLKKKWDWK